MPNRVKRGEDRNKKNEDLENKKSFSDEIKSISPNYLWVIIW